MKVVASNNSFVYDELGEASFRLVNTEAIIVQSGDEVLAAVRADRPELVVMDASLPGLDGYRVCEQIKADPELALVRVILVLQGAISARELDRLARCGCDDVMVYREQGDTLYRHAARLLGLPDPSLALPVTLDAVISDCASHIEAHATQLSTSGAELLATGPIAVGVRLGLRLGRSGSGASVPVTGEVTSCVADPSSGRYQIALRFGALTIRQHAQLADLALWDSRPLATGVLVTLRGSFDEKSDFSHIQIGGAEQVVFDVSAIARINSWGARQWIMFLRSLPLELEYCFVNASTEFVKHCNMVTDMLGRGHIVSFAAPYVCRDCGRGDDRVLQASAISTAVMHAPPEFRCPRCGGSQVFDETSFRYFAFLSLERG